MEITSVRINKVSREGSKLKGYATVVIDDAIMIHNIRIIKGEEKDIVAMPVRILPDGRHEDVVHPLNSETRAIFEKAIFEEYNRD